MAAAQRKIMFLCTGNYYRSRFAELVFNAKAQAAGLDWVADSRGLRLDQGPNGNVGPISEFTIAGLKQRQIPLPAEWRSPRQVSREELAGHDLVIALKEAEHRSMLESRHPEWAGRVEYWHVHDLDQASADQALAEIETLIDGLITRLAAR
ncbi:MAG: low molecular weight phosphatase family protein [Phycisphaerae bacterium]